MHPGWDARQHVWQILGLVHGWDHHADSVPALRQHRADDLLGLAWRRSIDALVDTRRGWAVIVNCHDSLLIRTVRMDGLLRRHARQQHRNALRPAALEYASNLRTCDMSRCVSRPAHLAA